MFSVLLIITYLAILVSAVIPPAIQTQLMSSAIPYHTLKEIVGGRTAFLSRHPNLNDDDKLLFVGHHVVFAKDVDSLSYQHLPPIKGYLGVRVYARPSLPAAIELGARVQGKMIDAGRKDDARVPGVCSIFVPVHELAGDHFNGVKEITKEYSRQEKIFGVSDYEPYSNLIVVMSDSDNVEMMGFPKTFEEKLVSFCEPMTKGEHLLSKDGFESNSILVSHFYASSPLRDLVAANFLEWARATRDEHPDVNPAATCGFCHMAQDEKYFHNNDGITVFPTTGPVSKIHVLAIPLPHKYRSIGSLTRNDIGVVNRLKDGCIDYFKKHDIEYRQAIYGFHAPWHISVNHLHLHCVIPPLLKITKANNFRADSPNFFTVDRVVALLNKGITIPLEKPADISLVI